MRYIIIITDCHDVAFNEIRASIINSPDYDPLNMQIEPVIRVKEFSLINCAFLIRLMAEVYPEGSTIMALCSPTIEKPSRIYGVTKNKKIKFFATNNGIISWLLDDFGIDQIFIADNRDDNNYLPFGGKLDYAPATIKIAKTNQLNDLKLGRPAKEDQIKKFQIPDNTIVHIDNFGLCKIKSKIPNLKPGDNLKIYIRKKSFIAKFSKRMMSLKDGSFTIYPGSSLGLPEFGIVRKNAAKLLNLEIGDKVYWNEYENKNKS